MSWVDARRPCSPLFLVHIDDIIAKTLMHSCTHSRLKCVLGTCVPHQRGRRRRFCRQSGLRHLQQDPPLLQREERFGSAADDGGVGHGRDVRPAAGRLPRQLPGVAGRHLQVRAAFLGRLAAEGSGFKRACPPQPPGPNPRHVCRHRRERDGLCSCHPGWR